MKSTTIQLQKKILLTVLFGSVFFLFSSTTADARIVVEGDRKFTDEVNNCFTTYEDTPGVVGDVIKELQRSKFEHKIIKSPNWTNTPNDMDEATGGSGSGSVTRVDSKKLKEYVEKIESLKHKGFCTALLHEMWHAVDNERGTRSDHSHRVDGAKHNEVEATLFQNLVHALRGVPPRTSYGRIDISKHVVIGHGDEEVEDEPQEEVVEATPIDMDMNYAHVKPGEYSEVYLKVKTTPGATVDVTLEGPGVRGEASQSKTADGGETTFTWRIVSYGTYSVKGSAAGTAFTNSVEVQ